MQITSHTDRIRFAGLAQTTRRLKDEVQLWRRERACPGRGPHGFVLREAIARYATELRHLECMDPGATGRRRTTRRIPFFRWPNTAPTTPKPAILL